MIFFVKFCKSWSTGVTYLFFILDSLVYQGYKLQYQATYNEYKGAMLVKVCKVYGIESVEIFTCL